jgi:predicted pyridoxine 5'-phosphate oxidase superfamily flavin-nucleotide-binding protein
MLASEHHRFLRSSVLCWLATVDESGQPSVSPKEIFCAHGDGALLIAHIASPRSVHNIQLNPKVCVSFVDIFVQKGAQVYGQARVVSPDDPEFEELQAPLKELAGPKFPIRAVIYVDVETVKEIVAPRYRLFPGTTEEDQIRSAEQTYGVKKIHG